MHIADRLVVLQEDGLRQLPSAYRRKTRVIYQSARSVSARRAPAPGSAFDVVVSGHLREEKDPFRTAAALAHLPPQSRIRVVHMGKALSGQFASTAKGWMSREPRYRWMGELSHGAACRRLALSRLMVISSSMEGGANVVSEALVAGVPVLASRVCCGAPNQTLRSTQNCRANAQGAPLWFDRNAKRVASQGSFGNVCRPACAQPRAAQSVNSGFV